MAHALDEFGEASLWSMSNAAMAELVVSLERLSRRVSAAQVRALAQADASNVAAQTGAASTAHWLRDVADVPIGLGKARLELHRSLVNRPITSSAYSAGDIGVDAATMIVTAMHALPAKVPAALNADIEQLLVDIARDDGVKAVTRKAAEITHRFAPEVLEGEERRQRERRFLTLTQRHDGALGVRGLLDKEAGALVLAVLGPLAAPAPAIDGTPDLRNSGQRYADALSQLCQLATPALPTVRGERPNVLLTLSWDALQSTAAAAPGHLETGAPISIAATRRILCDANVVPVVLGSEGQPLDVGRSTRVVPTGLRRALIVRDGGCVFPGCDRPPSWCDAHHRVFWSDGGATELSNVCLLCDHHHKTVHHDGWEITMRNSRPWFVPPPWIDPSRTPRQHSRHKVAELRCSRRGETHSDCEDDLAENIAREQRGEPFMRRGERQHAIDDGSQSGGDQEVEQADEFVAGAHGRADDAQLLEKHPVQLGRGRVAAGRAARDDRAARPKTTQ
jgi:Domain of unknown function (DUF222)